MGDRSVYAKISNCSFLLRNVYSLRLLAYRDLLRQLTPPSVLYQINMLRFQVTVVV